MSPGVRGLLRDQQNKKPVLFQTDELFQTEEDSEYNCIPGPEGLAGTLRFVASWLEV